jgi:hypothetical protein
MRSPLLCVAVLLLAASTPLFGQLIDKNTAEHRRRRDLQAADEWSISDADRRWTLEHGSEFVAEGSSFSATSHTSRDRDAFAKLSSPFNRPSTVE